MSHRDPRQPLFDLLGASLRTRHGLSEDIPEEEEEDKTDWKPDWQSASSRGSAGEFVRDEDGDRQKTIRMNVFSDSELYPQSEDPIVAMRSGCTDSTDSTTDDLEKEVLMTSPGVGSINTSEVGSSPSQLCYPLDCPSPDHAESSAIVECSSPRSSGPECDVIGLNPVGFRRKADKPETVGPLVRSAGTDRQSVRLNSPRLQRSSSASSAGSFNRELYEEAQVFPINKVAGRWRPEPQTASSKADYGLDDLQNLNVKDRFSVFERTNEDDQEKTPTSVEVKRSQSILDKMKKFQGRGPARAADSADDTDGSGDEGRAPHDPDTVRSSTKKERPMSFSGLGDVKSRFEAGGRREPAPQDPAKGELAKLRGMICGAREHKLAYEEALREQEALSETRRSAVEPGLVAQGNLRESYERAVQESESPRPSSREEAVVRGRAADMASRFEKAQLETENGHGATQNGATSSRELTPSGEDSLTSDSAAGQPPRADSADGDAAAQETAAPAPAPAPAAADPDLPHTDTTKRMLDKFKQMEKNSGHTDEEMSPHREKAHGNARQMLSKYRQMQEQAQKEDLPDGPRPLKSFTPPPEEPVTSHEAEDAAEDADVAEDPDIVRASSKVHDEFLNKRTDQARSLRDKFESWAPQTERSFTLEEDCKPSLEITRNLRAKFESMKEQPKPAEKPQQHRASKFIIEPNQAAETCSTCNKRVYAMERLEVDKRILHKNCFRCSKCNCVLRMDTYTFNAGKLFCTPHFKQMFKTKGNYDEGFGLESRAKHWSSTSSHSDHSTMNGTTSAAPRPAEEVAETNGSANLDSGNMNGSGSPEPEPEQEQEQGQEGEEEETHQSYQRRDSASDDERVGASESEPEPEPEPKSEPELKLHPEPEPEPEPERGADVFQRVYESTVADGL